MKSLKHYLHEWHLTNPCKLAETPTSHVYLVDLTDRKAVLKVLTPLGQKDESDGAVALRHFNGHGAVQLLNADQKAHLLAYVDGRFLKELVTGGKDFEATEIICDVLQRLHGNAGVLPFGLKTMKENFLTLFAHAKANPENSLLNKAAQIADHLIQTQREAVVLHGDIHHKNILESSQHGWLAIDPKGLLGERAYDFANAFYNPDDTPSIVERPERIEQICSTVSNSLKTEPKRVLAFAFAYGCLSACWAVEDGLNPTRRLRIAGLINGLLEK